MADINPEVKFDAERYLRCNPDVQAAGVEAYAHWRQYGRDEERRGLRRSWLAPSFDETGYRAIYSDVAALIEAGGFASGAEHWFFRGRDEMARGDRSVPETFSDDAYLVARPDVAAEVARGTYVNGFEHWLQWGAAEAGHGGSAAGAAAEPVGAEWHGEREEERYAGTAYADQIPSEMAEFWSANGYLILPGAIPEALCDAMSRRIDRLWVERRQDAPPISIDTYLERPDSRRIAMRDAPGDVRALPYKINDMFLVDETARNIALHDAVLPALRWVLRADPAIIGSLNFERGSTQKFHTDTLYMPGKSAGGMTAAWFALEDVTAEAGPLLYYSGSHHIPLFRFSSGRPAQINEEVPNYDRYMQSHAASLGLVPTRFLPRKGDVLIWHERLYHGGSPIEDLAQTRKSLVVHYWRADEVGNGDIVAHGGGFYWNRAPLA